MSHPADRVSGHYARGDLGERILAGLRKSGKDPDALTVEDLAPVDGFHIRGRMATDELLTWAAVESDHRVLDVGSGVGGTARFLASRMGCHVTGIDLTPAYCEVAAMLSDRCGLADRTRFEVASALDLPFPESEFDVVWTEHVQMNVADKSAFYGEIARVLRPGGQFAFHDIFAGPGHGFAYPVPWAFDASISHLADVEDVRALLSERGFESVRWEDKTQEAIGFFSTVLERVRGQGWMPLGLHLVMGDDAEQKFANTLQNLEADRLRVVQAVMRLANGAG